MDHTSKKRSGVREMEEVKQESQHRVEIWGKRAGKEE